MELREAIGIYRARRMLGTLIIVLVVGGAFLWSYLQPTRFVTSLSFAVNRINKQQTNFYEYDGYYALQAGDLIADTVVSWLQSPPVLVEIYQQANVSTEVGSFRELTSRFKTKKYSAQNIALTYASPTEDEARRLATATTDVIRQRTDSLNRSAENRALFELAASQPVIVKSKPNPVLVGGASAFVGIVLALFLVPLVSYLRTAEPRS